MSKALAEAKAKIAKLDIKTGEGKAAALALARAGKEKANAAAHEARREAHGWADLVRSIEVDHEARARRRRSAARYAIIPAEKTEK